MRQCGWLAVGCVLWVECTLFGVETMSTKSHDTGRPLLLYGLGWRIFRIARSRSLEAHQLSNFRSHSDPNDPELHLEETAGSTRLSDEPVGKGSSDILVERPPREI